MQLFSHRISFLGMLLLLFIACALSAFAQYGGGAQPASSPLTGSWERMSGDQKYVITYHADGTGTLQTGGETSQFNWQLVNGVLTMNGGGATYQNQVAITADTLTMTGGDLPGPVVWYRTQVNQGGYQPGNTQPQNQGGYQPGSMPPQNQGGYQPQSPQAPQSNAGSLIGKWNGPGGIVQFNQNGTATIAGQRYQYSATADTITLTGSDGSTQIPYQLNGDVLTVTINGQSVALQRAPETQNGAGQGGGQNPPELVGKWAYMSNVYANDGGRMSNRILDLYANGSFQYNAETSSSGSVASQVTQERYSGTWSATDTTITFNSQSNGTVTYSLAKKNHPKTHDPMLVIDGDHYVTYGPKAPW